MSSADRVKTRFTRLERFLWASAVAWTVAVALSLSWNLAELRHHARESARIQARDAYRRDAIYRHWNASRSPVYVPADKETPPNPHLAGTPERDITTPSGRQLTLMNPAYMTRQVHELARKQYGVHAHLTSLKPINPQNAPDSWEAEALRSFRRGETEVSSVQEMAGGKYLRLIQPLMVKQSCLKCHAEQGYLVGDIRGGMSVAIPLAPLRTVARTHGFIVIGGHAVLGAMGLGALAFWGRRLLRSDRQRRRAESALRSAKEAAEAATRAKSEFLARMSHEIRTPMNSIMGFTQMLMDDELTAEQREAAQTVSRSGGTLLTLIDEVLDLSKIESNRMDLEEVQFSPETVVLDACELICARVGDRPIEILCDVEEAPSVLVGDPTRLRQVLMNLLGNAVKFTEEGEVVTTVRGREKRGGRSRLELEIRDTGIGIPEDKLDTIFETFTQADGSTTRKYGGTGLGLAICERIVADAGGRIEVANAEGGGAIFSIVVPVSTTASHRSIEA